MKNGKLIILSASSGAGKSTICKDLLKKNKDWKFSISATTRPMRENEGDGKDLGHIVEFKSEVQLSLDLLNNSEFGFSYNHISNASLGEKNPGANSYMFNFLKNF